MEFQDVLRKRRSVKHFDPDHRLADEDLRRLLEVVALTPSSFNLQNWHVVAVRDRERKAQLRAAAWDQAQVGEASLVLVLAGDLAGWKDPSRVLRKGTSEMQQMFSGLIGKFYGDDERLVRDEACRSIGLAAMSLMLAAKDMGLDSCPMIGFDAQRVAEVVKLPEHHPPLMMVVIGRAQQPAWPRLGLKNLEEFTSVEEYGRHEIEGEIDDS